MFLKYVEMWADADEYELVESQIVIKPCGMSYNDNIFRIRQISGLAHVLYNWYISETVKFKRP